jgi:hypothetical protein
LLLLLGLAAAGGCYRRVSYASPEGRQLELVNVGFDTQVASIHAETDSGSVTIEGASSQASVANKLVDLASDLAEAAREVRP